MPANRSDSRLCKDIGSFVKVHKAQQNREVNVQSTRNALLNSRALKLVLTGQKVAGGKHISRKSDRKSENASSETHNLTLLGSASISQPSICHSQSQTFLEVLPSDSSCSVPAHSQRIESYVVESVVDENAVFEPESWEVKKPTAVCRSSYSELAIQSHREAYALIEKLTGDLSKQQTPLKRVRGNVERCCTFAFPKLAAFVTDLLVKLAAHAPATPNMALRQRSRVTSERLDALRSSGLLADAKHIESQCATACATRLVLTVHFHVLMRFAILFDRVAERRSIEARHEAEGAELMSDDHIVKQFADEVVRLLRTLTFRVPESGSITVKILDAVFEREFTARRFIDQLASLPVLSGKASASGIAKWVESGGAMGSAGSEPLRSKLERFVSIFNEVYEELGVAPKRGTLERCGLVSAANTRAEVRDALKRFTAFELDEDSDEQSASGEDESTLPASATTADLDIHMDRRVNVDSSHTMPHVLRSHQTSERTDKSTSSVLQSKSATAKLFHGFGRLTESPIVNDASAKKLKTSEKASTRVSNGSPRKRAIARRSDATHARFSLSSALDTRSCTARHNVGDNDTVDGVFLDSNTTGCDDARSNMSVSSGNSNSCAANASIRAAKRSASARNEALGFACAARQPRRVMVMQAPAVSRRSIGSSLVRSRGDAQPHASTAARESTSKRSGASRALFGMTQSSSVPGLLNEPHQTDAPSSTTSARPTHNESRSPRPGGRTPLKRASAVTPRKSPRGNCGGMNTPRKANITHTQHTPRRSLFGTGTTPRRSLFSNGNTPRKRRRTEAQPSVFDLDSQSSVNVSMFIPVTAPAQSQSQSQTQSTTHRGAPDTPRVLRNYFLG